MAVRVRWFVALLVALLLGVLVAVLVAPRVSPTSPPEQRFDGVTPRDDEAERERLDGLKAREQPARD